MNSGPASAAQREIHETLDSCPVRPRHYALWGLAAGGTLLDGMSLAALAIALPLIKQTWSMSPMMVGAVSAGSVVGMAIGAIVGGWTSDRIGRRRLFLIGKILRQLCRQREIELVEGKAMPDHVHLLLSVPPKFSIANTVGFLKGKSAIRISRDLGKTKGTLYGRAFWSRGYCVRAAKNNFRK